MGGKSLCASRASISCMDITSTCDDMTVRRDTVESFGAGRQ
jgi:hypothetical protein